MNHISMLLISISACFLAQGCGKVDKFDSYQPQLNICDPQDNPTACPTSLLDNTAPSRILTIGNEGSGIRVDNPSDASALDACRTVKLGLLEKYIDDNAPYKGLFKGEYVASMSYTQVSEGSECIQRNVFRSCTKQLKFARIVCNFDINRSSSLK